MSRSLNQFYMSKDQELYHQQLNDLYEQDEFKKLKHLSQYAWDVALQIYKQSNETHPFYIVLMVVQSHERTQDHVCQFMVVRQAKNTGQKIKNSLVWYCDKQKKIFTLATDLCDLSQIKHWGERTPPSPDEKMLEQR